MASSLHAVPGGSTETLEILVIDDTPAAPEAIRDALSAEGACVRAVASAQQALDEIRRRAAHVAIVNMDAPCALGGMGAATLESLHRDCPDVQTLALTNQRQADICLSAWRAGAGDLLFFPADAAALRQLVTAARQRLARQQQVAHRNERLRDMCRRLSKSRQEISRQVDVLCQDLVKGYQTLAEQLQHSQEHLEFSQTLRGDLNIESLLRKTMSYLLNKLGAVNAVVFLPGTDNVFLLGAYLRHDTESDEALIAGIRDTLVRQVTTREEQLHLENDAQARDAFAHDFGMLTGRCWSATALRAPEADDRECMGALVMFRNQDRPLTVADRQTAAGVSDILAAQLAKVIRIHHRGDLTMEDLGDAPESFEQNDDSFPES